MALIEIKNLTKDYGNGRGIFDVTLSVEKGEVFGFVGANGAGKTTTIRHLMGFIKAEKGFATINGYDSWKDAAEIKKFVGYIPGEIAFPDAKTGTEFLKRQAELLNVKDMSYAETIIDKLQLDPTANLKRMSKGMKQKTAIVAALMADPEVLIFDEPTTGLDPLMRVEFLDMIQNEKKKGKTIFMSTHMLEEVEKVCDKVAFIKDGRIITVVTTSEIKHREDKVYTIQFQALQDFERFLSDSFNIVDKNESEHSVQIQIHDCEINTLMQSLKNYRLQSISENKYTFEDYLNSLV